MYDFTGPVLGSGAFATVLRVKDSVSGVEYAMKQVLLLLLLLPPLLLCPSGGGFNLHVQTSVVLRADFV